MLVIYLYTNTNIIKKKVVEMSNCWDGSVGSVGKASQAYLTSIASLGDSVGNMTMFNRINCILNRLSYCFELRGDNV